MNQCKKSLYSGYYCFKYEYDNQMHIISNNKHLDCAYEEFSKQRNWCKFNDTGLYCKNPKAQLAYEMTTS